MYLFVIFVVAALLQFYAFQGRTSATHVNVLNSQRVTLIVFFILLLLLSIFFILLASYALSAISIWLKSQRAEKSLRAQPRDV